MARLIDTDVLIELERRGLSIADLMVVIPRVPLVIASISASELLAGVHQAPLGRLRTQREIYVDDLLARVPVIPFDLAVARVHAQLWAELESSGQRIGVFDLVLAATALTHGHSIVTQNRREFDRVPELVVESPDWAVRSQDI
jgi:predicted nucleic acid-binding protein